MAQQRVRRSVALTMAMALVVGACSNGGGDAGPTTTAPAGGGDSGSGVFGAEVPRTFGLRLSEGEALRAALEPTPVLTGEPTEPARIDAILARLPEWAGGQAEQQPFNWPTESVPPPRTGATIDVPFPQQSPDGAPTVPTGPLQVARYQPEGDVPVAPYVAITFDQPMVEVGTVAQVNSGEVPATITPALDGTWQWVGTRTLRFDYGGAEIDRLPMATEYTVTVPAGTESATGGALATEVQFTFTTPAPTVQSLGPVHDSMALDQLWVAVFDQRIDQEAVLESISVTAGGDDVSLRLATPTEIDADDGVRNTVEQSAAGRWIAFRPVDPMPGDAPVRVEVGAGTPSAEGPRTTTAVETFTGRTYAPLRITDVSCFSGSPCRPGGGFSVQFNNELDASRIDVNDITVSPELPGRRVSVQWSSIVIDGVSAPRTEYTITLPAGVTDVFGQTLGDVEQRTVRVGEAQPSIQQFDDITTLDPFADEQQLTVLTVNHDELRVRVFGVTPDDYATYTTYAQDRDWSDPELPGWEVLADTSVRPEVDDDTPALTAIDLEGALGGRPGHVVVLVEPVPAVPATSDDYWMNRPALTWAQSTALGVDVFTDAEQAVVWATDLQTGAPLEGVEARFVGRDGDPLVGSGAATTDVDGVGRMALPVLGDEAQLLVATKGDDSAILPTWAAGQPRDDWMRWYVFDDRQVYRPGETIRVKGWVRRLAVSGDASLGLPTANTTVAYTVHDSYGVELATGTVDVGALGGFDIEVELPGTANLGDAGITLDLSGEPGKVDNRTTWHSFRIDEFRRPEFEVVTRPESDGPHLSTAPVTVAAEADYYAGGPLANAPVTWTVTTAEGTYAPPGWSEYTFGVWQPWWFFGFGDSGGFAPRDTLYWDEPCCGPGGDTSVDTYRGTTDNDGDHYLQIGFEGDDGVLPDLPVVVTAQGAVEDVNRQVWASHTDLLVHAADRYVGLRTARSFVRQGDPLDVDVVVTDIDGTAQTGVGLTVTAGRVEWVYDNGEWAEQVVDTVDCTVTSATEPQPCRFDVSLGGQYRVSAVVTDAHGGRNRTELTTWVSGAAERPSTRVEQEAVTVVPDRGDYAPGDTAELLVQAPFATGEGLLMVARNGIRSTERFTVADGTAVLQVPVSEADLPSLQVMIEVVGSTPRTAADGTVLADLPPRPAYAVGGITLPVSLASRTLTVEVAPVSPTVTPGADTSVDVTVTDHLGRPVQGAELAVVVVDEAVLALSAYTLYDPLAAFYMGSDEWVGTRYSRAQLRLLDPDVMTGRASGGGDEESASTDAAEGSVPATSVPEEAPGDNAAGGSDGDFATPGVGAPPITVRSQFDALALFEPSVTTDAEGRVSVPFTAPDTLTRYRVMVVAVAGADSFGTGESSLTAQLPLSVRPSAPRFANYGDTFELPVVVQNLGDTDVDVDVVLETSNLSPEEPVGQTVTVPAGGRVEVRFPVGTDQAGTAAYRIAVVSTDDSLADAATGTLPVYTPATAEAFATYGVLDGGAVTQPLLAPEGVIPQFGGLEVTTSSTSLQALTDAVLYITRYRYDSSDAMASRIMSIAALRDVLDAFDAEGLPSPAALDEAVTLDIEGLVRLQQWDGGWGWWGANRPSQPYHTVHVTHALLLARDNGYRVPQATLDMALLYLADIRSHIPSEYGEDERTAIRAYALWVLASAGMPDPGAAEALFAERGEAMQADALAWIWGSITAPAVRMQIERLLTNRVVETAGTANVSTSYTDDAYVILHSDRRTDGIVLHALIEEDPRSDLIPKLVAGLLAHRVQGRWDDIQENSFILVALHRYFEAFEAQTPDFVARVWLGDQFAGEHQFRGRETDRVTFAVPMSDLITAGDTDLVLANDGTGRLYYRIGLRYAPDDLTLDPLDRGFEVTRTYEAVDDPDDVWRDADGTWHVRAGARVRVTVQMVAEGQRTHVALIDPLPAGFEAVNPAFAVSASSPIDDDDAGDNSWLWWWGTWWEHQQLRDDRAEAFTTLLPAGVYEYTYVARATTPGSFVVPPARAEEMYAPETFGRAASDRVVVEP